MSRVPHITLIFCSLLLRSCNSTLEDPVLVDADNIVKVSRTGSVALKAGSQDSTIIIARIPKAAGQLDVSFKTTLGTFTKTASKEVKQYADSIKDNYRMAFVTLKPKPSADTGTAYVTVEVSTQRRRISFPIIK